jgi:uncharacterized membrane protein (DUF2068 family)
MDNTTMEAFLRRRPLGVSIIAALEGLQGVFFLISGLLALLGVIAAAHRPGTVTVNGFIVTGVVFGVMAWSLALIFLIAGLVWLLLAWGMWTLKRWAFWATVIIAIVSLANSVVAITRPYAHVGPIIAGMIIPIVILLYLLIDSNVRAAYHV